MTARDGYYLLWRLWLRVKCIAVDVAETRSARKSLRLPPAKLRFRVGENLRAANFLEVGRRTVENLKNVLDQNGFTVAGGMSVLDFGCGCGRTLMWFTQTFPGAKLHGSDVDGEAIAWCRQAYPQAIFTVNAPSPPLSYDDNTFDLIYGVSVFTHLDEAHQREWIAELHRLLKPGGVLLLSFHSRRVWENSKNAAKVAENGFVFETSTKLSGIMPDWYHTAFQSQDRIVRLMDPRMFDVTYIENGLGDHDLAAGRCVKPT